MSFVVEAEVADEMHVDDVDDDVVGYEGSRMTSMSAATTTARRSMPTATGPRSTVLMLMPSMPIDKVAVEVEEAEVDDDGWTRDDRRP